MNYAKQYCQKYEFVGHVWQGRFKSMKIESDAYLLACGNYIEMNPVRAGLTDNPKDWTWSSYAYYAQGQRDDLINDDPLLEASRWNVNARLLYQQSLDKTRTI
jgi:hypothetical protein